MGVAKYNTDIKEISMLWNGTTESNIKSESMRQVGNDLQENVTLMNTVKVNLGERSYQIYIEKEILNDVGRFLMNFELSRKIAVISNPIVWKFYGAKLTKGLKSSGFLPVKIIIPDGERYKNLRTVEKIYTEMLKAGIDRKGCVIALGGGVIGDIAGFVSATYMRGIKFVQVPTTLLAQVDASIGGKTGVDHKLGKNLIGAFHQPIFVLSDISTLKTLPEREYRTGLAEVIKYGIIRDAGLFEFMEKERERVFARDKSALTYIVTRSSEIKAEVVEKDEREETGLRSILNFGHTIGHAIEAATGYRKYLHGEAVAMGMLLEGELSDRIQNAYVCSRIKRVIDKYFDYLNLTKLNYKNISNHIIYDKKKTGDFIKAVLIKNIGNVEVRPVDIKVLKKFIIEGGY